MRANVGFRDCTHTKTSLLEWQLLKACCSWAAQRNLGATCHNNPRPQPKSIKPHGLPVSHLAPFLFFLGLSDPGDRDWNQVTRLLSPLRYLLYLKGCWLTQYLLSAPHAHIYTLTKLTPGTSGMITSLKNKSMLRPWTSPTTKKPWQMFFFKSQSF